MREANVIFALYARSADGSLPKHLGVFRSERAATEAARSMAQQQPDWLFEVEMVERVTSELRFFVVTVRRQNDEQWRNIVIPARHWIAAEAAARGLSPDPMAVALHPDCPSTGFICAAEATALVRKQG